MYIVCFVFKQKTAYEMRISDWSSDVCSSDLEEAEAGAAVFPGQGHAEEAGLAEGAAVVPGVGLLAVDLRRPRSDHRLRQLPCLLADGFLCMRQPCHATFSSLWLCQKIGRATCRDRVCPYV